MHYYCKHYTVCRTSTIELHSVGFPVPHWMTRNFQKIVLKFSIVGNSSTSSNVSKTKQSFFHSVYENRSEILQLSPLASLPQISKIVPTLSIAAQICVHNSSNMYAMLFDSLCFELFQRGKLEGEKDPWNWWSQYSDTNKQITIANGEETKIYMLTLISSVTWTSMPRKKIIKMK